MAAGTIERRERGRALRAVALFWLGYLLILFGAGALKSFAPASLQELAWGTVSAIGVLLLSLIVTSRSRFPRAEAGLSPDARTAGRFAAGWLIGFAMYALHLVVIGASAGVRVERGGVPAAGVLVAVSTYFALSCMEEIGFRGYALRRLERAFGFWPAQGITAVAFALTHVAYGWPVLSVAVGVLPGGFLFGMAAAAGRGLALPIALHAAWNVADWAVGQKGGPALWTIASRESALPAVSTISFVGIFVLGTIVLWLSCRRFSSSTCARGA
ncbi:MAG TPA: type II CAAX endopeptidase family protein [Thermoanaerobaculia bacterium]|nr:type II CAAX endopeptidase family protein [Thermoanaerobaculia bacterium]